MSNLHLLSNIRDGLYSEKKCASKLVRDDLRNKLHLSLVNFLIMRKQLINIQIKFKLSLEKKSCVISSIYILKYLAPWTTFITFSMNRFLNILLFMFWVFHDAPVKTFCTQRFISFSPKFKTLFLNLIPIVAQQFF